MKHKSNIISFEVSILLGCVAALSTLFPMFQDNVVDSSSRVFLVISTPEDETIAPSRNVRNQLPSDAAPYTRRTESSVTLL
jgi:hypothetical protein